MIGAPIDYPGIEAEVRARGISRLIHFTQSRKLAQILMSPDGIVCSADLQTFAADVFDANDPQRFDNRPHHISCSIEYPNIWMLRKAKGREKFFQDWVALAIDRSLIWQVGTLFSPRNAAAQHGALLAEGLEAFRGLFADSIVGAYGRKRSRSPEMLPCVPTDDQAEVMILNAIPLSRIFAVITYDSSQAALEIGRLRQIGSPPKLRWIVAPSVFTQQTSEAVRLGVRPPEYDFIDSPEST